jgi:dihydroneopterin aldolase
MVSSGDRTIDPNLQRFEAEQGRATVNEVAASHLSMISHSSEVVKFIETAAEELIERQFAHVYDHRYRLKIEKPGSINCPGHYIRKDSTFSVVFS